MPSRDQAQPVPPEHVAAREVTRIDRGLIIGILIAFGAIMAGIAATAIGISYFLQPVGALIVLGGTVGVVLITTPVHALLDSARRVKELFSVRQVNREALIEEIVQYARVARRDGMLALEPLAHKASSRLLRDAILLSLDSTDRIDLRALLETDLRMRERQGEMDAKVLEVAGGFAPTIGILGTVVGLIDVLRHFSNVASVGHGIGTAFVSTIYGLAPGKSRAASDREPHSGASRRHFRRLQELILESVIAIADGAHPFAIRQRLSSFLRPPFTITPAAAGLPAAVGLMQRPLPLERSRIGARTR